ncbi:MAG: serine/threonine protein kinase [Bdellovibrionales bacterium]|nr:serine/threonine protein kinase [Bdellovibrionales bacterium]
MSRSVFDDLNPDVILSACEELGFLPTGEITQLNSYENRVFDIKVEADDRIDETAGPRPAIIAKFYRPGRWSHDAIRDEHLFLSDLRSEGIAAVAPFQIPSHLKSLRSNEVEFSFEHDGFITAVFPKKLGRMPQEFVGDELKQVGRLLARIHNVGARRKAIHRPTLNAETYGYKALDRLQDVVYPELWNRYRDAAESICEFLDDELDPRDEIRIHGDCHKGNLIQYDIRGEKGFNFVDFDDCCNGTPVQDFFMLLSGASDLDEQAKSELDDLLTGYDELRSVPDNLYLLEALRGLRILHYAGWIAARWDDPFFPSLFPDFHSYNWWADECLRIEQIASGL